MRVGLPAVAVPFRRYPWHAMGRMVTSVRTAHWREYFQLSEASILRASRVTPKNCDDMAAQILHTQVYMCKAVWGNGGLM